MDMNLGKLQEMVRDREAWRAAVRGITKSQARLDDWTTLPTDFRNCLPLPLLLAYPEHCLPLLLNWLQGGLYKANPAPAFSWWSGPCNLSFQCSSMTELCLQKQLKCLPVTVYQHTNGLLRPHAFLINASPEKTPLCIQKASHGVPDFRVSAALSDSVQFLQTWSLNTVGLPRLQRAQGQ